MFFHKVISDWNVLFIFILLSPWSLQGWVGCQLLESNFEKYINFYLTELWVKMELFSWRGSFRSNRDCPQSGVHSALSCPSGRAPVSVSLSLVSDCNMTKWLGDHAVLDWYHVYHGMNFNSCCVVLIDSWMMVLLIFMYESDPCQVWR